MPKRPAESAAEAALSEALRIRPSVSSAGRGWQSLETCLWRGKLGEYFVDALPDVWLILHASGSSRLTSAGSGRRTATPGLVSIIPAGMPTQWMIDADQDAVTVHLSSQRLQGLLDHEGKSPRDLERLPLRFAVADPLVAASLEALLRELRAPQEAGSLYADRLADVLVLHLIRTAGGKIPESSAKGGLSPQALRRACERLEASAERGISLEDLAREVGMSRFHFARAFRRSTAKSPHQYLTDLRVERAKQMLLHSDLPVVDVALAAGFGSQSHFTHTFRRTTGLTPAAYRRQR
jgi:AraC family transcriptional regulator